MKNTTIFLRKGAQLKWNIFNQIEGVRQTYIDLVLATATLLIERR